MDTTPTKQFDKKKFIESLLENDILVNSDIFETGKESFLETLKTDQLKEDDIIVFNKEASKYYEENPGKEPLYETRQMDKAIVSYEKKKPNAEYEYKKAFSIKKEFKRKIDFTKNQTGIDSKIDAHGSESTVKVVFSYKDKPKKREPHDFVEYFVARYKALEKLLRNRQELSSVTSISRVLQKKEREVVTVIGMVKDIKTTKNDNLSIVIEDLTGEVTIVVNKTKPQLFAFASNITFDEVIGVVGANSNKTIFANNILQPDVPSREIKTGQDEVYAIFLSDMHVGSKYFLGDRFEKFLKWINLESGNEQQRQIAEKVKYIFVAGDIVDGVGIYPNQDAELDILDIREQYEAAAKLLAQIPTHIKLIICPGNHDAMRLSEPQPIFYKDLSGSLLDLPNATFVTNPSLVNIHSSRGFSGFDVLLYHGYSFDYYIANIDHIRQNGGYDRADLVMKFLMQRRHLAPTHTSTLYIPDAERDNLVIDTVPDFFLTGHIHKTAVAQYKATTMICGSCWQDTTSFQLKMGHHPEPARVPIANLKTREMKVLRF